MSIKVELDALAGEIVSRPIAYLLTAGDDGPPHASQAAFVWDDDRLVTGAGRTTVRHVGGRPTVSVIWPPAPDTADGFTLIVDGDAEIVGADETALVQISPTWAVLHRTAPTT